MHISTDSNFLADRLLNSFIIETKYTQKIMKYLRYLLLIALFFQVISSAETQLSATLESGEFLLVNQNKFTKKSDINAREDKNLGSDDEYVSTNTL